MTAHPNANRDTLFQQDPELEVVISSIIKKYSYRYSRYLSPTAIFTAADLQQEGWMVWMKIRKQRYRAERSSIVSFFTDALVKQFISILRYESRKCRNVRRNCQYEEAGISFAKDDTTPERAAMVLQALEAIAEANSEVARLFVEGVPEQLLREVRVSNRLRAASRGRQPLNYSINITQATLRRYFKINLKKLALLANRYM
jgi:hypothetical protein